MLYNKKKKIHTKKKKIIQKFLQNTLIFMGKVFDQIFDDNYVK